MPNFSAPASTLNFYTSVPITDGTQVIFEDAAQQTAYFSNFLHRAIENVSNIDYNTGFVVVDGSPSDILLCNYLSFLNPQSDGIPFFAKITGASYIGVDTVSVDFEVDYWQTFMFRALFTDCYVEREHLTAGDQALAVANPYRNDIPQLLTAEDLPVDSSMEVSYMQPKSNLDKDGNQIVSANADPVFTPAGTPGLVTMIPDYTDSVMFAAPAIPRMTIYQIATFAMDGDGSSTDDPSAPSFSEFSALWSWFDRPDNSNGYVRPFYLAAIRDDAIVFPGGDRSVNGAPAANGMTAAQMLLNAMNWLTYYGVSSQIVGHAVVPTQFQYWDYVLTNVPGGNNSGIPEGTRGIDIPALPTALYSDISNPKLYRNPYHYIRVVSPDGSDVSYMRERFGVPATVRLAFYANMDDVPSLTIAPIDYDGHDVHYKARLAYEAYPVPAYATDGYLTSIAAKQQAVLAQNYGTTKMKTDNLNQNINQSKNNSVSADLVGLLKGAAAGDLSERYDAGNAIKQQSTMAQYTKLLTTSRSASSAVGKGSGSHNTPDPVFGSTRGAYLANDYHAGNSANSMFTRLDKDYFEIVNVCLRPSILEMFDNYFSIYGYATNNTKLPNVLGMLRGVNSSLYPNFVEAHVGYVAVNVTYCKTSNLKVFAVYGKAAEYIENLFNSGCRFIDGRGGS